LRFHSSEPVRFFFCLVDDRHGGQLLSDYRRTPESEPVRRCFGEA
jgi:hypothetical protein